MQLIQPGAMLFIDVGQVARSESARGELSAQIPHHYVGSIDEGLAHLASHRPIFVLLSCLEVDATVAEQCAMIEHANPSGTSYIVLMLPEEIVADANLMLPGVVGFATFQSDWSVAVKQLAFIAGVAARLHKLEAAARNESLAKDAFGIMRATINIKTNECTAEPALLHAFALAETVGLNRSFHWKRLLESLSDQARRQFALRVQQSATTGGDWQMACRLRDERADLECRGIVIEDKDGVPAKIIVAFRKAERLIETADPRVNGIDSLSQIRHQIHSYAIGSLLLVRIENHRELCKSLGYEACDHIVTAAMARMGSSVRNTDLVLRAQERNETIIHLGGPDLLIVLGGVSHGSVLHRISTRVEDSLRRPIRLEAQNVPLRIALGHATWPGDGSNANDLLNTAALRLESGLSTTMDDSADLEAAREAVRLEADLYDALRNDELELYFQPKYRLDEEAAVVGAEALLRWRRNGSEWIPPDVFIPIAEQNGLIISLGEWVIEEAVRCQVSWRDQGLGLLPVSINVSAVQLLHSDFVSHLLQACERGAMPREAIEIEITESCLIKRPEAVIAVLKELKTLGFGIALDDFGTGYSSLSYLRTLPLDVLKIDRSFVQSLDGESYDPALTAGIIGIGLTLGLRIVAEGIETSTQWRLLKDWGCHHGQGFLMSRPVPQQDLATLLHQHGSVPARSDPAPAARTPPAPRTG